MSTSEAIARGRQRADAAFARGVHDLEQSATAAPEWEDAPHGTSPTRALLLGMLDHLHHHEAT